MIYSNYVLANGTLLMNLKGRGISEAWQLGLHKSLCFNGVGIDWGVHVSVVCRNFLYKKKKIVWRRFFFGFTVFLLWERQNTEFNLRYLWVGSYFNVAWLFSKYQMPQVLVTAPVDMKPSYFCITVWICFFDPYALFRSTLFINKDKFNILFTSAAKFLHLHCPYVDFFTLSLILLLNTRLHYADDLLSLS